MQIAYTAAHNVRLGKQATKLLMLFEDQKNGFRPSLKFIEQRTGIAANKISELRQELVRRGMIGHSKSGDEITIDWKRMRIYAGLPNCLPKRGVHNPITLRGYSCRRNDTAQKKKTIGEFLLDLDEPVKEKKYIRYEREKKPLRQLSEAEIAFYKRIESLTVEEWNKQTF